LGFPDVDEFLRQIPARMLTEWETYFRLEPWGSDYSNKTVAIQTRLLAHYVYRKQTDAADWLPQFQQIQDGEDRSGVAAKFLALTHMMPGVFRKVQ
jgi:hypothetical protein